MGHRSPLWARSGAPRGVSGARQFKRVMPTSHCRAPGPEPGGGRPPAGSDATTRRVLLGSNGHRAGTPKSPTRGSSMLQIAAVILEPLAAAALNEEGRRTQQGEQEQERADQREEAYSQAYRKAQSACRKFPRKAYKWGSRRMEPHSARTLARFPCSDQNSRGADHILLTETRGNSTVRWPLRGATVSGGDH
jgi:hypothetical protein